MNKVLQELKENLQLQEDQSRSVATQISAIKCEVAPPQLHKVGVQFLLRLRLVCFARFCVAGKLSSGIFLKRFRTLQRGLALSGVSDWPLTFGPQLGACC